jgi:hypothetical protein
VEYVAIHERQKQQYDCRDQQHDQRIKPPVIATLSPKVCLCATPTVTRHNASYRTILYAKQKSWNASQMSCGFELYSKPVAISYI